jgi:hypothetical protein
MPIRSWWKLIGKRRFSWKFTAKCVCLKQTFTIKSASKSSTSFFFQLPCFLEGVLFSGEVKKKKKKKEEEEEEKGMPLPSMFNAICVFWAFCYSIIILKFLYFFLFSYVGSN